ncbi:2-oxo-4-hydroxy-4-carboxy-5-ureidoimidazoline decarboxylase [Neisseriaceae bacterium TC5R-5]|nr:2-oxo-4-hydroxy-4-carboxy-5-ureidoimidazoline decarboxylase [Neisseriaceae bacterium TC5R-5]
MSNKWLFVGAFLSCLTAPLVLSAAPSIHVEDLNQMTQENFEQALQQIFERAPWAVQQAAEKRPYKGFVDLYEGLIGSVKNSDHATQLALIRSHPDLACKGIRPEDVAQHSQNEQSGAGLNQCTQQQADQLRELNTSYQQKFGFPFMLAVKGYNKADIVDQMQRRIEQEPQQEFDAALQQIYKVVMYRLLDTVK